MGSPAAAPLAPRVPAPHSGLDLAGFDRSVRPQDNLYAFVAGGWLAHTQIPDDQSNYGTFTQLDDNAHEQQRVLLEEAVRAQAEPGSVLRKAADFYASFMDLELIEALGRASGMLRREVTQRLGLRYAPELRFLYDEGLDRSLRVEELLAEIEAERRSGGRSSGT